VNLQFSQTLPFASRSTEEIRIMPHGFVMRRGIADGSCLYLKVDKSGAKRWILRLVIHGKRHDLGVGGLSLVSLAEAREEAVRLRKIARAGGDPLAERRKQRRAAELGRSIPTFDAAARQVYAEHSKTFRNELHKKHWIESLEKFVFPFIGDRRMDQIDTGDVLKALTPIWLKVPETARRVKQRTKVIFDWAKASGYRKGLDNPVEGVEKLLPKHNAEDKHFTALLYANIPAFIRSLRC
jgi:hypothetical protein